MKSIISGHNKQVLHPKPKTKGCNCRDKNTCPLDNKCLTPKGIDQADVTLMTLMRPLNLQKHLLKIDIIIINLLSATINKKIAQNCLNTFGH